MRAPNPPRIWGRAMTSGLKPSGPDETEGGEPAVQRAADVEAPPFSQHGGIETAEIDRVRQVAVAVEAAERRRWTEEPSLHPSAEQEVRVRGAMVGAVGAVLARPAAEFGVGHDERRVPAPDLDERRLERGETVGQILQQARLRARLVAVGVEAVQRNLD